MKNLFLVLLVITVQSCQSQKKEDVKTMKATIEKTDAEWKAQLSEVEYEVLRNKGTERAFTGEYWNHFEKGKYVCAACENDLFLSQTKFESDCGWPSFDKAIEGSVIYKKDTSFGMTRTEVMCAKCNGHLGHVFDDGPRETTGQRFCTNSVSVKFIPRQNNMLIHFVNSNLEENIQLLRQLSNEELTTENMKLSGATIGEHIRHSIELLDCLLVNYETGIINYDIRQREVKIQTDVNYAISILENQVKSLEKSNKKLSLVHNCYSESELLPTNYFRELLYNLEHSIHHQALIKVALFSFPHITISNTFGIAPSTLAYRKECVQ